MSTRVRREHVRALTSLEAGAQGVVRQLRGGRQLGARLAALGLTVGAEVVVFRNDGHGPIIVLVRDGRVALGSGEALKVWVETAEG